MRDISPTPLFSSLENRDRLSGADHLYGFSAECGLKALMVAFGMEVDPTGRPQRRPDQVHVDRAWMRYQNYRSGMYSPAYDLPSGLQPFDDWRASDRYEADGHVTPTALAAHREGADLIHDLVKKATMNGVLP